MVLWVQGGFTCPEDALIAVVGCSERFFCE